MKIVGTLALVLSVIFTGLFIAANVRANYEWDTQYSSYWSLGVKASTIKQKSEYVDKFIAALQSSGLQGTHNALWYFTPDNSFDDNFMALQSLQSRLHDISSMDENSFSYQSAIQQITAQEQDDNNKVIDELSGSWFKVHHPFLWNPWYICAIITGTVIMVIFGIASILI